MKVKQLNTPLIIDVIYSSIAVYASYSKICKLMHSIQKSHEMYLPVYTHLPNYIRNFKHL